MVLAADELEPLEPLEPDEVVGAAVVDAELPPVVETAAPVVGSSWPQSACSVDLHSAWAVEFCVLAAMQFW